MEEDLTGVLSLGEVSMAEIVSLSQCAMGIGPCCLKISARALNRRRQHSEIPWAGVQATKASDAQRWEERSLGIQFTASTSPGAGLSGNTG